MMIRFTILQVIYCLISVVSLAQDHLEPTQYYLGGYEGDKIYFSQLDEYLLKDLPEEPEIQVLILPPGPESVLQIVKDPLTKKFEAIYVRGINSVWNNVHSVSNPLPIGKFEKETIRKGIREEDALILKALFIKVIKQTKYENIETVTVDGVSYYFTVRDFGRKSGKTWSPSKGTIIGEFTGITYEIIKELKSLGPFNLSDEVKEEIDSLIGRLEERNNN